MTEWGVTEDQLGCLLRLSRSDTADLLAGNEPTRLDFAGALHLGVVTSALTGIASRVTPSAVRAAIDGNDYGGAQALAVFEAADLPTLLQALEALEQVLAKRGSA